MVNVQALYGVKQISQSKPTLSKTKNLDLLLWEEQGKLWTHSLSHRRAVPGRRKRFDILLAEHKNRTRERERERELHQTHSQQTAPLRDPHPSPQLAPGHDTHPVSHGNGPAPDTTKPLSLGKPKFHSPGLPRLNNSHAGGSSGDPSVVHESPHYAQSAPDALSRPSSDEGENEEREDGADKLDCLYSGYHPRPAAYCTFGSRLIGRGFYSFDRRWDRVRCALTTMMEKHVNSQMWKKIPLALENSSLGAHRTSTNSHSSTPSSGFLSPPATLPQSPYSQSSESKSSLSYGTTLNAHSSFQGGPEHPAYGTTQARQVSSLPQMPSTHLSSASSSSAPSPASGRAPKSRSSSSSTSTKSSSSSFKPKEISSFSSTPAIPNSTSGGSTGANINSSSTSFSSGKKRKNSSVISSSHCSSESSSNASFSSSSSSFKKNCANVGSSGSTYHHSSLGPSSSLSSSHSGVHSVGLNCGPSVRTNSLSLKAEPSGGSAGGSSGPLARGPPSGSPAESIKRMSVVMNSSDSTLSLGPFVHHQPTSSSDHHTTFSHHSSDGRLEAKKRKSSSASSGINSGGGSLGREGAAGGTGPGRPKITKSPALNNIHGKHGRSIPGTPGLPNNSHLHQVGVNKLWLFH
ncbi:hypothetical protein AMECASPLE_029156 [Ameca splendens]|uniref:SCA7 domain-containing protein n=1 Tax=Ameca splendens TaxID=208324 RepID=A0ABV0ZET8_9TELE